MALCIYVYISSVVGIYRRAGLEARRLREEEERRRIIEEEKIKMDQIEADRRLAVSSQGIMASGGGVNL